MWRPFWRKKPNPPTQELPSLAWGKGTTHWLMTGETCNAIVTYDPYTDRLQGKLVPYGERISNYLPPD